MIYTKDAKQKIVKFISENPGCGSHQIQKHMGGYSSSFYKMIKNMQEEGLVHRKGNTNATSWYVGEDCGLRNDVIMRLNGIARDLSRCVMDLNNISQRMGGRLYEMKHTCERFVEDLKNDRR